MYWRPFCSGPACRDAGNLPDWRFCLLGHLVSAIGEPEYLGALSLFCFSHYGISVNKVYRGPCPGKQLTFSVFFRGFVDYNPVSQILAGFNVLALSATCLYLQTISVSSASMIFQSDSLVDHHAIYLPQAYSYTTCWSSHIVGSLGHMQSGTECRVTRRPWFGTWQFP